MPIKETALIEETRTLRLTWPGQDGDLNFTYRPRKWTPELLDQQVFINRERQRIFLANSETMALPDPSIITLLAVLVSWDLLDDKGKPFPITEEVLRKRSDRLLRDIVEAINEDIQVNPLKPAPSESRLLAAASAANGRTGRGSFE